MKWREKTIVEGCLFMRSLSIGCSWCLWRELIVQKCSLLGARAFIEVLQRGCVHNSGHVSPRPCGLAGAVGLRLSPENRAREERQEGGDRVGGQAVGERARGREGDGGTAGRLGGRGGRQSRGREGEGGRTQEGGRSSAAPWRSSPRSGRLRARVVSALGSSPRLGTLAEVVSARRAGGSLRRRSVGLIGDWVPIGRRHNSVLRRRSGAAQAPPCADESSPGPATRKLAKACATGSGSSRWR